MAEIHTTNKKVKIKPGGFTLVEMIIVIFIITLITSGFYISSSRFSDNATLTNIAYDISSTISQMQSFGLSVKNWQQNWSKNVNSSQGGFDAGYGVEFNYGDNQRYKTFTLDSSGTPNYLSFYQISGRDTISSVCVDTTCLSSGASPIWIFFRRSDPDKSSVTGPEPDAFFSVGRGAAGAYTKATVTVATPGGISKTIVVTAIGQIYVQ